MGGLVVVIAGGGWVLSGWFWCAGGFWCNDKVLVLFDACWRYGSSFDGCD